MIYSVNSDMYRRFLVKTSVKHEWVKKARFVVAVRWLGAMKETKQSVSHFARDENGLMLLK